MARGIDPLLAELGAVADIRSRKGPTLSRADWVTAASLGVGFVAFAAACAALAPAPGLRGAVVGGTLVVAYGLARRTEFVAPTGSTVPTEPVLIALLFSVPVGLVPALVLAGLVIGGTLRNRPGGPAHELLVRASEGWHCAGPVLVVWLAELALPSLDRWPLLVLALATQFLGDAAVAWVRCVALGSPVRRLAEPLLFTFTVDSLLAPLAICVVVAVHTPVGVVALSMLPVGLLRVLSVDRNRRLSAAVTLGQAFRSVRQEARADPLTGVSNRRAWEEAVAASEQMMLEQREPRRLATVVLIADIDHLKAVNDNFGHESGDELLRTFAQVLRAAAPEGALVARLGGDEFGLLFQDLVHRNGEPAGVDLTAKLRAAMARRTLSCGEPVSASLGIASSPPMSTVADAIRLADSAAAADKDARHAQRAAITDLRTAVNVDVVGQDLPAVSAGASA